MTDTANSLLEELNSRSPSGGGLTVLQIYQLGVVLDHATTTAAASDSATLQGLQHATRDILEAVPLSVWENLEASLMIVLAQGDGTTREALGSLAQLYRHSTTRYPSASMVTNEFFSKSHSIELQPAIAACVAEFMLKERDFEVLLPVVCDAQELPIWSPLRSYLAATTTTNRGDWKEQILSNFEAQREYLASIFDAEVDEDGDAKEAATVRDAVASVKASIANNPKTSSSLKKTSPEQELIRRIEQVKMVFPSFGEGFIEAALSQFRGDVEETVASLLDTESNWPRPLQQLDRSLPRRHRVSESLELDTETKALFKANLQATTAKAEQEAYLLEVAMKHDEYNDDYDDQYDDITQTAGNRDQPDDYESIRVYNTALKGIVSEQAFWDDNRNTNRSRKPAPKSQQQSKSDDDEGVESNDNEAQERKYRGPDKMRGGRVPGRGGRGRGRGGGRGETPAASAATTTEGATKPTTGKPNLKSKQRKLDKRRDKQKQAQSKRTG